MGVVEWNGVIVNWNGIDELDLTWFFNASNNATIYFRDCLGFYTLKLNSKSLIWLKKYNWHQKPSIPFGSVPLDYSKVD